MAEHPGDLGQGHTDLDHLAGKRVAKPVCPNDRHIGTRTGGVTKSVYERGGA